MTRHLFAFLGLLSLLVLLHVSVVVCPGCDTVVGGSKVGGSATVTERTTAAAQTPQPAIIAYDTDMDVIIGKVLRDYTAAPDAGLVVTTQPSEPREVHLHRKAVIVPQTPLAGATGS